MAHFQKKIWSGIWPTEHSSVPRVLDLKLSKHAHWLLFYVTEAIQESLFYLMNTLAIWIVYISDPLNSLLVKGYLIIRLLYSLTYKHSPGRRVLGLKLSIISHRLLLMLLKPYRIPYLKYLTHFKGSKGPQKFLNKKNF